MFRVEGAGFRVLVLRVKGSGFRVQGPGGLLGIPSTLYEPAPTPSATLIIS